MNTGENVREGIEVLGADGGWLGTVRTVQMGDPQATTVDGQLAGMSPRLTDMFADAFRGQDAMPAAMQERLLRLGPIDVDGAGLGGDSG